MIKPLYLITLSLGLLILTYFSVAPNLITSVHIVVLALSLTISLILVIGLILRRGQPPHWRIQLGILGALVVLTGISYQFSFNATMRQRSLLIGVMSLSVLVLASFLFAQVLRVKLPQRIKLFASLFGLGALLIGTFFVFPHATLYPTLVLCWCGLIVVLLTVNLIGIFQDIQQMSPNADQKMNSRRVVSLASGTVFTMVAMLPVLIISVSLIGRISAF